MISKDELISEAVSLPVETRLQLVERRPASVNPYHKDIDDLWAIEVQQTRGLHEDGR